jgi:hypothetical protein
MSDDTSIENEPAVIYELGKSCIDLHDHQFGIDLVSKLIKTISNDKFTDAMIRETNKMRSNYLIQIENYQDEVKRFPVDEFYYK